MDPALKALRFDGGSFEEEDDGSPDEEQHFDDSEEEMASYGLGMSEYSDEDARGDMKDTDEGEQRDRRLETEKDLKPARRNLPSVEHEPRDSKWFVRNTAVAPDFVSKFFQSSRLHHLSAWKNTLKQLATKPKKQNGSTDHHPRTIMHVDMDCFFASIAIRDKPHLAKQPVAVCHSQHGSEASTSEIASCNYIARSYGIKNGQLVGPARRSCPELVVVPYEFEKYEDATKKLYQILHRYADEIQPCSCDEALIDVSSQITNVGTGQEVELARQMRRDIKEATGCNASIGISENILLARMATKKAKPNGEFYLASSSKIDFLADCKVGELPGVGWSLSSRLEARGVVYCKDLMAIPKHELQHDHGSKTGEMLYNFARGIDNRPLESESKMRKTVGAEINWGIRLQEMAQVERFLRSFCDEVSERLATAGVKGRSITLKLKQRKADAGEPYKFLGCGDCDNYSKSVVLGRAVDSSSAIYKECLLLYRALAVPPPDLRGVGIHLGKLEEAAAGQDGQTTLSFPRKLAAGNASNSPQRGRSQGTVEVKEEDNKAEDHIRQSSMDALWPGALPPGDRSTKAAPASFRSLLSPQPIQLGKTPSTTNASALPQNSALITAPEPNANLLPTEEFRKRPLEEAVAEPSEDDPSLPPWAELDPSWLLGLPEDQRLRILKVYAWRKHQQTGAGSSAQSSLYGDQYPQTLHASHSRSKKARTEFKTQPTLRQAWKNVEPNHATGGSGGSPLYNPSSVQRTLKQTWQRKGTTPTGADSELPDPGPSSSGASHGQQLDWTVLNELPEDIREEILREYHTGQL